MQDVRREGECCIQMVFLSPIQTFFVQNKWKSHSSSIFDLWISQIGSAFEGREVWRVEKVEPKKQGIQQSHTSNDMTWECLERRVNTSRAKVRITCIYTFLHLYSISENLPEEFVSPVVFFDRDWSLSHGTWADFSVLWCSWQLPCEIVAGDHA